MCATGGHRLRFRVALYSIPGCIWGAHFRHVETPAIGPPTTRRKRCHDTGLPAPLFDQCRLLSAGSSCTPETPVLGALGPGGCAMKVFDATPGATRTAEPTDAGSPWYRRPGILIAAAALVAGVGIVVSGPREPGTAPGGTTGTSTPWSASYSLIATDIWEPPPPPPPPPRRHRHRRNPPRRNPRAGTPPCGNSGVGTPRGGSAASSSASSATGAGVKVRRPVDGGLCVDYQ